MEHSRNQPAHHPPSLSPSHTQTHTQRKQTMSIWDKVTPIRKRNGQCSPIRFRQAQCKPTLRYCSNKSRLWLWGVSHWSYCSSNKEIPKSARRSLLQLTFEHSTRAIEWLKKSHMNVRENCRWRSINQTNLPWVCAKNKSTFGRKNHTNHTPSELPLSSLPIHQHVPSLSSSLSISSPALQPAWPGRLLQIPQDITQPG